MRLAKTPAFLPQCCTAFHRCSALWTVTTPRPIWHPSGVTTFGCCVWRCHTSITSSREKRQAVKKNTRFLGASSPKRSSFDDFRCSLVQSLDTPSSSPGIARPDLVPGPNFRQAIMAKHARLGSNTSVALVASIKKINRRILSLQPLVQVDGQNSQSERSGNCKSQKNPIHASSFRSEWS